MKLKINSNETIDLIYSFRANIYYEQIQGHSLDFTNFTSSDLLTLFYCVVVATLQKKQMPPMTMLEFMDILDDNGGDHAVLEFSNWYTQQLQAQYDLYNAEETKDNEETKK